MRVYVPVGGVVCAKPVGLVAARWRHALFGLSHAHQLALVDVGVRHAGRRGCDAVALQVAVHGVSLHASDRAVGRIARRRSGRLFYLLV